MAASGGGRFFLWPEEYHMLLIVTWLLTSQSLCIWQEDVKVVE